MIVALEPSGTYGEIFRHAVHEAGLIVHRVSGKAAHDYAEVFDGVPSQHDGKDAAVIAELAAIGKSDPWPVVAEPRDEELLSLHADLVDIYQRQFVGWCNRVESWLARHWPEVGELLELGFQTLLRVLEAYGSPAALARDDQAALRLRQWGGPLLKDEKIASIVDSARETVGIPCTQVDMERVGIYVTFIQSDLSRGEG